MAFICLARYFDRCCDVILLYVAGENAAGGRAGNIFCRTLAADTVIANFS